MVLFMTSSPKLMLSLLGGALAASVVCNALLFTKNNATPETSAPEKQELAEAEDVFTDKVFKPEGIRVNVEKGAIFIDFPAKFLTPGKKPADLISVTPEVDFSAAARGGDIYPLICLEGKFKANTTYQVEVKPGFQPCYPVDNEKKIRWISMEKSENFTAEFTLKREEEDKAAYEKFPEREFRPYDTGTSFDSYRKNVSLFFRSRIHSKLDLKKLISITPAVDFTPYIAGYNNDVLKISGDFKPDTLYKIVLKPGMQAAQRIDTHNRVQWTVLQKPFTMVFFTPEEKPALDLLRTELIYPLHMPVYELPADAAFLNGKVRVEVNKVMPGRYADFIMSEGFYGDIESQYSTRISRGEYPVAAGLKNNSSVVGADFRKMGIPRKAGIYEVEMQFVDAGDNTSRRQYKQLFLTDMMPLVTQSRKDCNFAVLSLKDSKPVAGAKIKLYSGKRILLETLTTDANGIASVTVSDLKKNMAHDDQLWGWAIIEKGDDVTFLDLSDTTGSGVDPDSAKEGDYAFVTPERDLCKPGEKLTAFAMLRDSVTKNAAAGVPVTWIVTYPNGTPFRRVNGTTDSNGFCRVTLDIPADSPTGMYHVKLCKGGENGSDHFGVSSFTVAEYTPDTITAKADTKLSGDTLENSGSAKYYFGTPLVNGDVYGTVFAEWTTFKSKIFKDHSFLSAKEILEYPYGHYKYEAFKTKTDEKGNFVVKTQLKPLEKAFQPVKFTSIVTVQGKAARSISMTPAQQIKHFADYYVGVKLDKTENNTAQFSIPVVTPDDKEDKNVSGLTAELFRLSWHYVREVEGHSLRYVWQQDMKSVSRIPVENGQAVFRNMIPGDYSLRVCDKDSNVRNVYNFWYCGSESGERTGDPAKLYFTLDNTKYLPGSTAAISFESSLDGNGIAFAGDAQIHSRQLFAVKKGKNTLRIPIPADHANGDYHVNITIMGKRTEKDPNMFYQEGIASLKVDQTARKLHLSILTPEKARPGETVEMKLQLKNGKDQTPASGLVQLWAVDSGVLALSGFRTPDPFKFFFRAYGSEFRTASNLSKLIYVEEFKEKLIGGDKDSVAAGGVAKYVSDRMESAAPTATFLLDTVSIPATGEAVASVKLPDHTGELTVMALAVNPQKVGNGECKMILRDTLSIQLTVPRVLAPGDEFNFSFEAFNHELPDGEAEWKISDLKGVITVKNAPVQGKFKLAKGASAVIDGVNLKVAPDAEHASFRVSLSLAGRMVTEDCRVTVRPALPKQTFVTSKWLKKGESATLKVEARKDVLEIGSSSIMISGALDFLREYPYGCTEQITSGAFPYLAVKSLAKAGHLEPLFLDLAESVISNTINELNFRSMNGAWYPMWRGSNYIWQDASFFAWHFLLEAANAGYTVNDKCKKNIDNAASNFIQNRSNDSANRAYVTYILSLLRGAKAARYAVTMLSDEMQKFDDYSRFLLAAAVIRGGLAQEGMAELKKLLKASFWESASGVRSIDSLERRLGLALWILSDILPAEDPALIRLIDRINSLIREDGHWGSTQSNAWCVLGLAKYNAKLGNVKTDATLTIGTKKEMLTKVKRIKGVTDTVTVTNHGDVPVYIRHSEYKAPEKFEPASNTLKIKKVYRNADGKIVTKAKKGELLTVTLEITQPGNTVFDNLVLVDLLPGGLEVEDDAFKTRYSFRDEKRDDCFGERQERRFDRVIVFGSSYFYGEALRTTYKVRAVTPGKYAIPPVRIESMYLPEINATDRPADVFEVE